ncbi:MAG: integrase core domain-containing protein [Gemmataceae bacterium]
MTKLVQAFFLLLASATDRQLAQMVEYLKQENRILRARLPKRLVVTPSEQRRLVKLARPLGSIINQLIGIVSPRTMRRWLALSPRKPLRYRPGPKGTSTPVKDLVLRLAEENHWGYTRILGELKKLGIRISRTTVINILKQGGFDPGPKQGRGSWAEWLTRHAKTLHACDFFTQKVWSIRGPVDFFVLVFLHVGTRRLHIVGATTNPNTAWVKQQARNYILHCEQAGLELGHLVHDHDTSFSRTFDAIFQSDAVDVRRVGPVAPNLNAYCERVIQTVQQECFDHFTVFGEAHLRWLCSEFEAHYNAERPHQGMGNSPLSGADPPVTDLPSNHRIVSSERLGGLLKSYRRVA